MHAHTHSHSHDHTHDHVCWGHSTHSTAHHHRLEVSNLAVSYRDIQALQGINFRTECSRSMALIGPNGAGKSTLLKSLAGLVRPDAGKILWRGKALVSSSHEIAYLPQRGDVDWNFPITVRGLVEMGRYPNLGLWKRYSKHDEEIVERALTAMNLLDLQKRQISALSGGQQQRTFIARALAQEAHVLLLDEPFTGLDKPAQEALSQLFRELTKEGRLLIASHHDLQTVPSIFDDVLLLKRQQVAFGPVKEVFTEETIKTAYAS
ncbi:manganese/iron transport system ATP-binding protein/manganese/zinc/iron transport system ATP- binding protein [Roseimicrobium gellanilyticum]|uniref:Manganese/iron transport system ATP-binding protein/manganese/zinc/iron transport system ATP-binding protein n=1 Tax=Roseimicrobium gellanilyticum TaxID=748857 RepID=A0A366HUQ3_9BACT|nr:metal ABC transporter ATP-binding protein [Roseimicrobium gellanilyticum]RBP48023.1 manganese/iron transport system ATP-binding protein/manganese/zinc/iron transport system ATP- binding protein [Roseimicrobium gellanilyticum]